MRRVILLAMLTWPAALGCSPAEVLSPFQRPPAVSISVQSAVARPWHTTIVWRVENGSVAPYPIERRYDDEPWKRLTHRTVEQGRIVFDDYASLPGALYTYRVRLGEDHASAGAGEVTVRVPR